MSKPLGFDRVANVYPQLERLVYRQWLQRGRLAYLPKLVDCKNILLLGEGNGRFLHALLTANRNASVTVVEISPKMIATAKARLPADAAARVTWLVGSALEVELPAGCFDAVVTHYLFDLFEPEDQRRLVEVGTRALAARGTWQDTEFIAETDSRLATWRNRLVLGLHYRVLGACCKIRACKLHDHTPLMRAAGLQLGKERTFFRHFAARLWVKP